MRLALSRLFVDGQGARAIVAQQQGRPISGLQFQAAVSHNAHRLRQAGCRRGLLLADDSYWAAVGLFALLQAGAEVVLPQNVQLAALGMLAGAYDRVITDRPREGLDDALLLADGESGMTLEALSPALPLSFFTSGSTGQPKRVSRTLGMLEQEAAAIEAVFGSVVPTDNRVCATVTHQHVYGLAFRLCWPLASGRTFEAETHEIWESAVDTLQAGSALVTSPAHLERLDGVAPIAADRRPALILSAGAPLSEAAVASARIVLGIAPTEIFGSTETGALAFRSRQKPDEAWHPLPGVRLSTVDGVMAVEAAHVVAEGRHLGADLIDLLPDGRFHFLGRADRVVKIEGKRVSLPEVETHLRSLPWVSDAAAVMLPEPARFAAVVVPSAAGAAKLTEIGPFRFGRLLRRDLSVLQEPAGLPRQWRFVAALPTGLLGKHMQADLAALFEAMPLARPTMPVIRCQRPVDDGIELDLTIPADLAQLEGHFPGRPVLPGVVQIDWVMRLAAQHMNLPEKPAQNFQVKFRSVATPEMQVTLALRHNPERQRLSFEYRTGDAVLSSGSIRLAPA